MTTLRTRATMLAAILSAAAVGNGCMADEAPIAASQSEDLREVAVDCSINGGAQTFEEVRDLIYGGDPGFQNETYAWDDLPKRGSPLAGLFDTITGGLSKDCSQIIECDREWRENLNGRDKIIHAPGVCASAVWAIDEGAGIHLGTGAEEQFTGLFASGTKVNTIVRLSTATNVIKPKSWPLQAAWSIGVKLFPAPADQPDTRIGSVNFAMFDQLGVGGTRSREMLRSDDGSPRGFANWLYGDDFAARTLISTLDKFVRPHENRGESLGKQLRLQAIDSLGLITQEGQEVALEDAHYPTVIKLQLGDSVPALDDVSERLDLGFWDSVTNDFRKQLLAYDDGEIVFDIIADTGAEGPNAVRDAGSEQRIGTLTLDRMVVSDMCDLDLTFKHSRNGKVFSGWAPSPDGK